MNINGKNVVLDKSFAFSVRIIKLYQYLRDQKREFVLSKQLLRCGTSIGANVEEAHGGISNSDFSSKMSIAYKEARETHYWLRLLKETDYIDDKMFSSVVSDCEELCKLTYSIINSTRINPQNKNL